MKLYFAPLNFLSNYVYRHLLLKHKADFVFSELILIKDFDKEVGKDKLKIFDSDISKTVFQIGVSSVEETIKGVKLIKEYIPNVKEINLNVDCPESRMQKNKVCSGLLFDLELLESICLGLIKSCNKIIPSVKIRLGTSIKEIKIKEYLQMFVRIGIKKVYIHARTLRYSYNKPALYNELKELRSEFNSLELIFNGDVDSYENYLKLNGDVMIGRAALTNPLLFEQIKSKTKSASGSFNPVIKDINIVKDGTKDVFLKEKRDVIIEFLELCLKEDLRMQLVKNNLNYLMKGVSSSSLFLKNVNTSSNIQEVIDIFKSMF
jgi:tRNA-dihydrouridine synthase